MADNCFICGIETDVFPDAGITVADAVVEGEIPTDTHQHGCVQSDVTVSTIVKLAGSSPLLRFDGSRHIRFEHAGHIAKQITVYPYFGTIIDTVYLKPDDFVFIVFRYVKFRAEPIGVELASCFGKIWDDIPV